MAIELTPHQARPHASEYALELLADEYAVDLCRSATRALSVMASRDRPDAHAMEWAFLHFVELRLGMAHEWGR